MSSDPTQTFPAAEPPPPRPSTSGGPGPGVGASTGVGAADTVGDPAATSTIATDTYDADPHGSGSYESGPPAAPAEEAPLTSRPSGLHHLLVAVWSLALAIAVFGPLLTGRGVLLRGDMVFVPKQVLDGAGLGLDGWTTGSVPIDFVVGALSTFTPGDLLQKAIFVATFVLAGTGAGAALRDLGLVARLAAATVFVWNPFVYERLLTGDWALLVAYATLPWIVWAARRVTTGDIGQLAPVVAFLALAAIASPVGGGIALLLAVVLVARRGGRAAGTVLVGGLLVNLVWIVPGFLRPGGASSSAEAAQAYAATAEGPLGVVGSLLSLGGIWDQSAYVPGRDQMLVAILAIVFTAIALAGVALGMRRWDSGVLGGVAGVAALGFVIALLGGFDGTSSVIESLVDDLPGGGGLADGHVWLAPLALLLALGFGTLAGVVAANARQESGPALVVIAGIVGVALPIAVLPGLAWAANGAIDDSRYPADWWEARQVVLERDPSGILVLPFTAEREFPWNEDRTTGDPARAYFPGDVLVEDQRVVGDVVVPGRDPRAAAVREALDGTPEEFLGVLTEQGIDTVIVQRGVSSEGSAPQGTQFGERLFQGAVTVWAVDAAPGDRADDDTPDIVVIIADVLALLVGLGAVVLWVTAGRRRDEATV